MFNKLKALPYRFHHRFVHGVKHLVKSMTDGFAKRGQATANFVKNVTKKSHDYFILFKHKINYFCFSRNLLLVVYQEIVQVPLFFFWND
jgi:hypothetical protein